MKFTKIIICICFSLLILCLHTYAYDISEVDKEIDTKSLWEAVPDEIKDYIPDGYIENFSLSNVSQNTDNYFLIKFTGTCISKLFPSVVKTLFSFLSVIILVSVIRSMNHSFVQPFFSKTINYFSLMVLAIFIYNHLVSLRASFLVFVECINTLTNSMIPIMSALCLMGGNVTSATVFPAGLAFLLTIINKITTSGLIPMLNICFGLSVAGIIGNMPGISFITGSIKKLFTIVLTGALTLLSVFVMFKTMLSSASDGVMARGIKFAGSFVPIVGSALGESVRGVMSGLDLIKKSVGFIGLIIILVITLPPVITLILNLLCAEFLSGMASVLRCEKESLLLKEYSGLLGALLSVSFCLSVTLIFVLTVYINLSSALGGV